ncbi:MAG: substrate-binding domain-containing protein [Spirochaetaceae bacterium]|jgi:LacI family transcriptional regulator|nr:substrate-binding domain-containing protein [Spirochaetaceae bacterium]
MRITQKDIARENGVSLLTVSRALNNSGYVSKELKKRILEYAKVNNYIPHKASQALVRNKVHKLALFSSSLPAYFWEEIDKGVQLAADQIRPFNYEVQYTKIHVTDSPGYIKAIEQTINEGVDAVAIVNQRHFNMKKIFSMLEAADIPYITFNTDAYESKRICFVGSDYRAGGRLAAEYIGKSLYFANNPKVLVIQHINEVIDDYTATDINGERLEGFESFMKSSFPDINYKIEYITTRMESMELDHQIEKILKEKKNDVHAIYLIPAFNTPFLKALEKLDFHNTITILHDIDPSATHLLQTQLLTAVIHQEPIFQGYYAVKTLEHIVGSQQRTEMEGVEIVSNLILSENRNVFQNHHALLI